MKKCLKTALGVILIVIAIVGGLYFAIWLGLFCGMADFVNGVNWGWQLKLMGIGALKILLLTPIATLIATVIGFLGLYLTDGWSIRR